MCSLLNGDDDPKDRVQPTVHGAIQIARPGGRIRVAQGIAMNVYGRIRIGSSSASAVGTRETTWIGRYARDARRSTTGGNELVICLCTRVIGGNVVHIGTWRSRYRHCIQARERIIGRLQHCHY